MATKDSDILHWYAGPGAMDQIRQHGLREQMFDYVLGASGGPKWFVLAGLDRAIFGEFFKARTRPLSLLGSSAGAFRFACLAQQEPVAAINRLAKSYANTVYSTRPKSKEISAKAIQMLDHILGQRGVQEVLNNPVVKVHFVVARCLGLSRFSSKAVQMTGLLASAGSNLRHRRNLGKHFERVLFAAPGSELTISDPVSIPTHHVRLDSRNFKPALLASGSIPVVLDGVRDIPGAPPGMYRDGGIVDYHFDLGLGPREGLTLYPHFAAHAKPGWFDKSLTARKPHRQNFHKVIMVVPSPRFVQSLPYGKIPDRNDFKKLPPDQRIPYWEQVISASDQLGDAFLRVASSKDPLAYMRPLPF